MKIKWTLIFLVFALLVYMAYAYYSEIKFDQTQVSQPNIIIEDHSFPGTTIRALDIIDDHTNRICLAPINAANHPYGSFLA